MSSQHAALIVDADANGLESLVYGFQAADWRITACPTPETASLLLKASGAEIVVLVWRGQQEKLSPLVQHLRDKEPGRPLPILVLGARDLRPVIKQTRGADLLPLPAWVRDVLTAAALLIEVGGAGNAASEEPAVHVDLCPGIALSLLRTMSEMGLSGQLRFERKGRQTDVSFHDGTLLLAQATQLDALAAVQRLLIWDSGTATVRLRELPRRGQGHVGARTFTDELDRFQRDLAHTLKDLGPLTSTYACDDERLRQSAADVPAEVTPVVRLFDGQRSLSDVLDESPFRVLDSVGVISRLAGLAILRRPDSAAAAETKPATAELEAFWQTARIFGSDPPMPSAPAAASSGGLPVVPSAASSGALPAVPFAPTPSELVAVAAAVARAEAAAAPTVSASGYSDQGDSADVPTPAPVVPEGPIVTSAGAAAETRAPAKLAGSISSASGTIDLPQRRTTSSTRIVPQRSSVVIDAVMDDAAKIGAPPRQAAPPKASESATISIVETAGGKVAGELQVGPSRRSSTTLPAQRLSIQVDAVLSAPAIDSASTAGTPASIPRRETPKSSDAQDKKPPLHPTPAHAATGGRQQSGHFSPIEKDFFAREADLYKDEGGESFADLDKPAHNVAKNGKNGSAAKKPGRK